jgi:hypothetical protein
MNQAPSPLRGFAWPVTVVSMLLLCGPVRAQPVTTVVTHGFSLNGVKGPWVEGMAEAVVARAGAGAIFRYRQSDGAWALVSGTPHPDDPVALIFRWIDDFEKPGPNLGFAEGAADALYAALRDARLVDAGGAPIESFPLVDGRTLHFMGHSRGACVNSETTRRFGLAGIEVDQVTMMDPHPVDGTLDAPFDEDWGDPTPQVWSNIAFADNYWRADGGGFFNGLDFDGIPIPLTLDVELDEAALECCGYGFSHSDTHLWYHGTIDLAPNPCDGEQCIDDTMRSSWWPDGFEQVGYYYAQLGGGSDARPVLPPGIDPPPVDSIYNGGFDGGSQAGWQFHGGGGSGAVVADGGGHVLQLAAGAGATAAQRHNTFWLPADASAISLDVRLIAGGAEATLAVSLLDADGQSTPLAPLALTVGDWMLDQAIRLGGAVVTARRYVLELQLVAGDAAATLQIDNVGLEAAPPCPADVTGDGQVNSDDLVAVILAWGTSDAAADVDGSGLVDVDDLLAVTLGWGGC